MTELVKNFEEAFLKALDNPLYSKFKLSGAALIDSFDPPTNIYSASLVPDRPVPTGPAQFIMLFKDMSVEGYKFYNIETVIFTSDNVLPKPLWRVQLKYTKI